MGKVMLMTSCLIPWVLSMVVMVARAGDPVLEFEWKVTYGTRSPLGKPEQVILINGEFPGPNLNTTTNNGVIINVFNELDEPLLFHWSGIQQRKNCWQDGTPGTMCPIPPGTNFTYQFQVKDQIGTHYYFPTTLLQKASGGFGGLRINSRPLIPVPFDVPEDDYTVLVGDWYSDTHVGLRKRLDAGKTLARPEGVLINGLQGKVGDPNEKAMFTVKPGKTYRYRICNVGMKNSINVRFQGHNMKLVELEGSHTVENIYDSLDVHLGQCYSVLVTADQAPKDYYLVATTRFTKYHLQATAVIKYEGSTGGASTELPPSPTGWAWSLNQFRSLRWNLTASAARPNPQGSYLYGKIPIIRTIKLVNTMGSVDGKLRYAINGVSHEDTETPIKLAQYYGVSDKVYKPNLIKDEPPADVDQENQKITIAPNVLAVNFRDFVEVIFENHEKSIQSWHVNGYSFFPVAIEVGTWSPDRRKNYNLLDAVSRHTIQVYPKSWAAVMMTFDNSGIWNIRNENPERAHLGQQLYVSVEAKSGSLKDEYNMPETALTCGVIKDMPRPPPPNH